MAKDPVCGMEVNERQAAGQRQHAGQTYYFCSQGCLTAFEKEPGKYAAPHGGHGHHGH
ncbi:MAG: YHS domain-containing protein [Chloroflexi bacterium]|nr:YHS domain-containing protein [Chloroflexota bacterium]